MQVKASNEILDSRNVTVSVDKKDLEYSGVFGSGSGTSVNIKTIYLKVS